MACDNQALGKPINAAIVYFWYICHSHVYTFYHLNDTSPYFIGTLEAILSHLKQRLEETMRCGLPTRQTSHRSLHVLSSEFHRTAISSGNFHCKKHPFPLVQCLFAYPFHLVVLILCSQEHCWVTWQLLPQSWPRHFFSSLSWIQQFLITDDRTKGLHISFL